MYSIKNTITEYKQTIYLLAICSGTCGTQHVIPVAVFMRPSVRRVISVDGHAHTFNIDREKAEMPTTWFMSFSRD